MVRPLGYLVRPLLGKHDTLKVNRMNKWNNSGGYTKKNRYNVDELKKAEMICISWQLINNIDTKLDFSFTIPLPWQ